MNILKVNVLISLITSVLSEVFNTPLLKSFEKLTRTLVESSNVLSFVSVGSFPNPLVLDQLLSNGIPYNVRRCETSDKVFELNTSAMIVAESIDEFIQFNEIACLTNNYPNPFQFFIHCNGATIDELSKLEENDKTKSIFQFEYFVVE